MNEKRKINDEKYIAILFGISAVVSLIYIIWCFVLAFYPLVAVKLADAEFFYDYESLDTHFSQDERDVLFLYIAGTAPIFIIELLKCDLKKAYSKLRGIAGMCAAIIFYIIHFAIERNVVKNINTPLLDDVWNIMSVLSPMLIISIMIFCCACSLEIFACSKGIIKSETARATPVKAVIKILLLISAVVVSVYGFGIYAIVNGGK